MRKSRRRRREEEGRERMKIESRGEKREIVCSLTYKEIRRRRGEGETTKEGKKKERRQNQLMGVYAWGRVTTPILW